MTRKTLFAAIISIVLAACSSHPAENWVRVEGNKFIGPDGNELIFRGLCFSDPVKLLSEGQWTEEHFAEAADWGAYVVRFAVHPIHLNNYGWEETFAAMDQGIEWAKKYNMYVIMDWHSIGNLKEAKFTHEMYEQRLKDMLMSLQLLFMRSITSQQSLEKIRVNALGMSGKLSRNRLSTLSANTTLTQSASVQVLTGHMT